MKSGIKVVAPASVSNLACGFDILGLALDLPCDEIIGQWTDQPGIQITSLTGKKTGISLDPTKNVATVAATHLLNHLGEKQRGIEFRMHKHIQGGSGLGSSGASAVAAVMLVNEMLGNPLEKRDLLPSALVGESLAAGSKVGDNVIPSLLGGLVLIRDIETLDYHRLYTMKGLYMAILLPDILISTSENRKTLNTEIALSAATKQSANLGSFVMGMYLGDLDLIKRSMIDEIIEPQRKKFIPHFDEVKSAALETGALACSISGAGPAIFCLCKERGEAEEVAKCMQRIYDQNKLVARSYVAGINHEGCVLK